MKPRRLTTVLAVLGVAATASLTYAAPLPPNTTLVKPGVGLAGTEYVAGLPDYFTAANQVTTLTAPMTLDFAGTVTSTVFNNDVGGYTFAYVFRNTGTAGIQPDLIRATFDPAAWGSVTITDAGADGSGNSRPAGGSPNWSDGDPYQIARADVASGAYPFFQWRVGNAGTVIAPGNTSSVIWLETTTKAFAVTQVGLLNGGKVGKAQVLAVPAPAAVLLGALGLAMIGWVRRRTS